MPRSGEKRRSSEAVRPRRGGAPPATPLSLRFRELTPRDWPIVERLFGERGACGGCWCMWWRVARGGRLWEQTKGEPARRQFRARVEAGTVRAVIAFDGDEPIGWCTFGPRGDFPRLETVRAYVRPHAEEVWSIPCFFIRAGHRGRGVGTGLLRAAMRAAAAAGAGTVEGYPVAPREAGMRLPAAFAWTGALAMFEACGFEQVQRVSPVRPLVQVRVNAALRRAASKPRRASRSGRPAAKSRGSG